mmetsp:Transcript_35526/g.92871  ORF Transcript_35526/g.92871 Transcript_35526/m.92871 type:complete len:248 (+) Transcript_35526:1104-1847(+)
MAEKSGECSIRLGDGLSEPEFSENRLSLGWAGRSCSVATGGTGQPGRGWNLSVPDGPHASEFPHWAGPDKGKATGYTECCSPRASRSATDTWGISYEFIDSCSSARLDWFASRKDATLCLWHPATLRHTAETGSFVTTERCSTPQNCNGGSEVARRTGGLRPVPATAGGVTESRGGGDTRGNGARRGGCDRTGWAVGLGWDTRNWKPAPDPRHSCEGLAVRDRGDVKGTGELRTWWSLCGVTLSDLP